MESDAGKGATFHFTILTSAATASPLAPWQCPQPQLAGRRLLLVEDSATNLRIISQRAEQWGMAVETAANSQDTVRLLTQGGLFDALILDWELPDLDELALADEIRDHLSGRHLPLLLLSAARLRGEESRPIRARLVTRSSNFSRSIRILNRRLRFTTKAGFRRRRDYNFGCAIARLVIFDFCRRDFVARSSID